MVSEGLSVSTARVVSGAEVVIDGTIESIPEGVVVDATVTVPWNGECRRCLRDIDGTESVAIREIFESRPTEGDTWPLDGDELDLAPMLRDIVLLALPLAPLCSEDCQGPAPDLFPALTTDEDPSHLGSDDDQPRDPRWAALDVLRLEPSD